MAVRHGSKLFCHGLTGSSVLLRDCIQACSDILTHRRNSDPRAEALHLLGSLLFLPEFNSSVPIPDLSTALFESGDRAALASEEEGGVVAMGVIKSKGVRGAELREKIVAVLFESAKNEPMRICRCSALYQVGMLIYSELKCGRPSSRLPEGIEILLASLQVRVVKIIVFGKGSSGSNVGKGSLVRRVHAIGHSQMVVESEMCFCLI